MLITNKRESNISKEVRAEAFLVRIFMAVLPFLFYFVPYLLSEAGAPAIQRAYGATCSLQTASWDSPRNTALVKYFPISLYTSYN